MASREYLLQLLDDNSTQKYSIAYGSDDLANHMANGLVALYGLGASEERLRRFIDWYSTRLVKAEDATAEHSEGPGVAELLGQGHSYYTILQHYTNLLDEYKSVEELVKREFPKLSQGVLGAAFHGLIQLGFGFKYRHRMTPCEGLAYIHRNHFPLRVTDSSKLIEPLGAGADLEVLDLLRIYAEDEELCALVAMKKGTFTPRAGGLFTSKGDRLLHYANRMKLPDAYDPTLGIKSQLDLVMKWLVDCAITVYVMSEAKNDFFLIHGVTAAYSLKNILPLVEDEAQINQSLRVFLCGYLATYMAQGCPALHAPAKSEEKVTWQDIIIETLDSAIDRDEHTYKLIHVCHEMDGENKSPEMSSMYTKAAQIALKYPLTFGKK